jgi:hypothetical protein
MLAEAQQATDHRPVHTLPKNAAHDCHTGASAGGRRHHECGGCTEQQRTLFGVHHVGCGLCNVCRVGPSPIYAVTQWIYGEGVENAVKCLRSHGAVGEVRQVQTTERAAQCGRKSGTGEQDIGAKLDSSIVRTMQRKVHVR